jgi:outer membrane protein TolC
LRLVQRRPDIVAAEQRVTAANAQIGVAQAAFFPVLSLAASGGQHSSVWADILSAPARFWSIGPALAAPLFDAGLRSAQKAQAIAAWDQAAATYRQTVLAAFQEVEDQLATLRILAEEAGVQQQAVKAARMSRWRSTVREWRIVCR